jgi:hypothetical protein
LMNAILAAVAKERQGINAAHLTARRIVELAFRCTREYFSALHGYKRNLRLSVIDRTASPRRSVSARRREWKTAPGR